MVVSSLPATSFVYAPELLYRIGLNCTPAFIPTNDTYLFITVYNQTSKPIECRNLQFFCTTTLTSNNVIKSFH